MKFDLKPVALTTVLCVGAPQVFAATALNDYSTFSGFSTLGVVQTDTNDAQFVRDHQLSGATKNAEFGVDSNMGAQLVVRPTRWLSATVQALGMQRDEEDNITMEVEWAFAKLEPVSGLAIRAGRMALPMFVVSDFRNVGYANTWIRPPDEVYGLAMMHRLEGADITYSLPIGSSTLSLSALAGESSFMAAGGRAGDFKNVRGANLLWETEWVTLRAGRVEGDVHIATTKAAYSFSGVGAIVDRNDVVAQAEYVMRRSEGATASAVGHNGWYVLGGYRFGSVLPYVSYADAAPNTKNAPFAVSGEQSTIAVGVRWDAFRSAAIKFQLQRMDTHGTRGISFVTDPLLLPGRPPSSMPVTDPVVAASLAVDFVF